MFNDCLVDLVEEGFDVVLCIGLISDVCMVVWLLWLLYWVMVVLLVYLVWCGVLVMVDDLYGYVCLVVCNLCSGWLVDW